MTKTAPDAKITWLPKKTFELEFSIPWTKVKATYTHVLEDFQKTAEIKGFRVGKAPISVVEKSLDRGTIYGEVVNHLLPGSYAEAVKKHNLKPALAPKITIVSAKEGESWQFKATACELPEVVVGDYAKVARGALAADKIWTPGKGSSKNEKKELTQTQKFDLVAQALIKDINLELPDLLIEAERDRALSRLLDQVQKLGLTIDQYAASINKTVERLRQEYRQSAENTLKLELILQAIAEDKNFKASDGEVDKMIAAAGDEKLKSQLNTPQERAYLASIIKKRQTIDYLTNL
ncbi:MAG: Trigger factor [Candidatus Beckwithbacteria bacterium GW2011_GWB1_47_15]|uniref:Trigger factor n=1 Tax=Candidatus Beckwithbacteria bacterium GW2011_GWB1_47_15 TaxID=1618371 RepID=A0A0G1RW31_9BACT|nr:MAG: tig, trigger factor, trigger factor [Candidatus Beckwithbacteria bacterium GW2011_GWC1_49_16]KKU34939.1 MAG: Trigger factor [Candidatus Beckwithbacteria bacterium GW2011_GWA1_46_30]KKU61352.1 MAG: Trigger factor [Candidatus Beckwithbacteria bacterium GW2011_GWB1_47_15]KKU71377.1 MAG: Trigger factor [Candidatus Beckwithbacteria bacterium GW2011_GWA2_47_25]OGD48707.1 MAG: hypothetical protein A2877_03470 [Candidatus Beckwithbacteria bacterium RIFCSPHIGHO2_01_FULL_49_39]OGD50208.1 MAG: hy